MASATHFARRRFDAAYRYRLRWGPLVLVLLLLGLWFGFLEIRGLYFPDEGRYAEIPREMLVTGDWVTPQLNGIPYFEKPPLQYWATAAVFAIAGEDEWSTRAWPALVGLLGVLALFATTRRLVSRRAGWMAAAVMGASAGYFIATQFVTLDLALSAFMTGALCAFLVAQDERTGPRARMRYMLLAWALCALAVLTKGVIGIAMPVLALAAYVAVTRDMSLLRRLHPLAGCTVFAAIVLPWFVLVELRNPGFLDFFFVHEHVTRFMQPVHRRLGPWWYFIPVGAAFLMPWLPAIAATTMRTPRVMRPVGFDAVRFAWCSAAAIFVFFSASSSKLPAYILPAIGVVAFAVAGPLARRFNRTVWITSVTLIVGGAALGAGAVPLTRFVTVVMVRDAIAEAMPLLYVAAAVLVAGGGFALWLLKRRRPLLALAAVVITGMTACQTAGLLAWYVDDYFSAERLIERISGGESQRPFRPDIPFYSVDMFDHTVPFYLRRTVTLVREKGELARGIGDTTSNYIADLDRFIYSWHNDVEAYAIMTPKTFLALSASGMPMRYVADDGRRVVVSRR